MNDFTKESPESNVDSKDMLSLEYEEALNDSDVPIKEEFSEAEVESEMLLDAKRNIRCTINIKMGSEDPDSASTSQPENNKSIHYYCKACSLNTGDYKTNLRHHLLLHGRKKSPKQLINFWTEPDIADKNFSCSACSRRYNNVHIYRRHLADVHFIPLPESGLPKGRPRKQQVRNTVPAFHPKMDETNLYCRDCNKFFPTAALHRYHITTVHKDSYVRNINELPDWKDPQNYCRSCDMTYSSVPAYHRHCQTVHKMNGKGPISPNEDIEFPDQFDSNFYCKVCDKYSANLKLFRYHCRYVHFMDLTPVMMGMEANQDLMPDIHDKQNRCQACDKTFPSKKRYHVHLRLYHKLSIKAVQKSIKPDPNDPNNFCCSCDKTFKNKSLYKNHLRRSHALK